MGSGKGRSLLEAASHFDDGGVIASQATKCDGSCFDARNRHSCELTPAAAVAALRKPGCGQSLERVPSTAAFPDRSRSAPYGSVRDVGGTNLQSNPIILSYPPCRRAVRLARCSTSRSTCRPCRRRGLQQTASSDVVRDTVERRTSDGRISTPRTITDPPHLAQAPRCPLSQKHKKRSVCTTRQSYRTAATAATSAAGCTR